MPVYGAINGTCGDHACFADARRETLQDLLPRPAPRLAFPDIPPILPIPCGTVRAMRATTGAKRALYAMVALTTLLALVLRVQRARSSPLDGCAAASACSRFVPSQPAAPVIRTVSGSAAIERL